MKWEVLVIGFALEILLYILVEILFYAVFHRVGQAIIFLTTLGKIRISSDEYKEWVIVIGFLVCAIPIAIFVLT